jgi:hypothetical protein
MADFVYDKALEDIGAALINLVTDTIKVVAAKSTYSAVKTATNPTLNDIASGDRVVIGTLANKTEVGGVFSADPTTLPATPNGVAASQLIVYKDTGSPTTSRLILHIDSATGLPFTGNGLDATINWPTSDPNKIFKI